MNFETNIESPASKKETKNQTPYSPENNKKNLSAKVIENFKLGDKNDKEEVVALQNALTTLGYNIGKSGVDGKYGKNTDRAYKKALNEAKNGPKVAKTYVDGVQILDNGKIRIPGNDSIEQPTITTYTEVKPEWHTNGKIDITKIAKLHGVTPSDIINLNPGIEGKIFFKRNFILHVPTKRK